MPIKPQILERAIADVLRQRNIGQVHREGFETFLSMPPFDLPMTFNLTTFAKDLANRLEQVR